MRVLTPEERNRIIDAVKGRQVVSLEWSTEPDGSDGYWVMNFDDGSEICFRFMAELY